MFAGHKFYGVLVSDRCSAGTAYVMHDECLAVLQGMLRDAGQSGARLVAMGPGTSDPGETCALTSCTRTMGQEATR